MEKARYQTPECMICYRKIAHSQDPGMELKDYLGLMDIDARTVIAIRNGKMVDQDCILSAGDRVDLITVIAGG